MVFAPNDWNKPVSHRDKTACALVINGALKVIIVNGENQRAFGCRKPGMDKLTTAIPKCSLVIVCLNSAFKLASTIVAGALSRLISTFYLLFIPVQ